jgi:hypothetical protein
MFASVRKVWRVFFWNKLSVNPESVIDIWDISYYPTFAWSSCSQFTVSMARGDRGERVSVSNANVS